MKFSKMVNYIRKKVKEASSFDDIERIKFAIIVVKKGLTINSETDRIKLRELNKIHRDSIFELRNKLNIDELVEIEKELEVLKNGGSRQKKL